MRTVERVLLPLPALVAGTIVFHPLVPNVGLRLGSLVETFLPWLGLTIPLWIGLAWWKRSRIVAVAAALPLLAWLVMFGGRLIPGGDEPYDLAAVQHNVSDENPDPAGTARTLLEADPDLVSLVEVVDAATYDAVLAPELPHHYVAGTVGLWSRYPLTGTSPVDIRPHDVGPDWNRGLRAVIDAPGGEVAVYVAHLPSVRFRIGGFDCDRRDESATRLGAALGRETHERLIVMGDLNATVDDRGLDPVTEHVSTDDDDFAFSWPAGLPVARIDQVLARGLTVTRVQALPATTSDHRPIVARLRV